MSVSGWWLIAVVFVAAVGGSAVGLALCILAVVRAFENWARQ